MSIYDNVAVNVSGHAFYVGDQALNNIFERNLGSQTNTIDRTMTISGENDYDAAAYFSRFPPNSFISNVASGNKENGFYFLNSNTMVRAEVSLRFVLLVAYINDVANTSASYSLFSCSDGSFNQWKPSGVFLPNGNI